VLHQTGQASGQALIEAGQCVGGEVFQGPDVDQGFQDRTVSPDIGSAQMGHAQKLDVVSVHG